MSHQDVVGPFIDGSGEVNTKAIKLKQEFPRGTLLQEGYHIAINQHHQKSRMDSRGQEFAYMSNPNGLSPGRSSTSVLERQISAIEDIDPSSTSAMSAAPICRQFWKAGNYEDGLASKPLIQNSGSYLHIHPKFLHSNATSHKWAFGAIAELLDNAVDEIQNGATYVIVDKTSNPRDGRSALLIQDDGGGMDPEGMRRCLSFGFSEKKSKFAIGHYGNGFKTSSMRLGADVIVFSRCAKEGKLTQSVGLLSYTFLVQSGYDRIVVPMVDYEFNSATGTLDILNLSNKDQFMSNLSLLLQWSPYSTEADLLNQFDDIGHHGTKVVIYNLWCTEEGNLELDFDTNPEDIRLSAQGLDKYANQADEQHMANQLRFSLRTYLSILYLRLPESFAIILRGKVVFYHNIGSDLKHPEIIVYRPHSGGMAEGSVIITIGFLKEAPHVSVHGFNVYHKNRLILPFWDVVSRNNSKGRGVVGVLEANFIVPTHNKQDFEKTSVFQKLEARLKDMTVEYWQYHCGLLGYHQAPRKPKATSAPAHTSHKGIPKPVILSNSFSTPTSEATAAPALTTSHKGIFKPVMLDDNFSIPTSTKAVPIVSQFKRKEVNHIEEPEFAKRRASDSVVTIAPIKKSTPPTVNLLEDKEMAKLMLENKKLQEQCMEHEKNEKELDLKATQLRNELENVENEYARLLSELQLFEKPKNENTLR